MNDTDNYFGRKVTAFSEMSELSVLNCYDNVPCPILCSIQHSRRYSIKPFHKSKNFRSSPSFRLECLFVAIFAIFLVRGYKSRFQHKSFLFCYTIAVLQHPPNIYDVLEENGDGSFDVIFGRQTASPKNCCQKWQPRLTPNGTR